MGKSLSFVQAGWVGERTYEVLEDVGVVHGGIHPDLLRRHGEVFKELGVAPVRHHHRGHGDLVGHELVEGFETALLFGGGRWVGGWVEEEEAGLRRCCGRWVGGWVVGS